jgi:hypothetical protein
LQPAGYAATLIGHKGKGSLLSLLKEKQLATALETDSWDIRGYKELRVQIELTTEGLNRTEDVICHVFQVKGQAFTSFNECISEPILLFSVHRHVEGNGTKEMVLGRDERHSCDQISLQGKDGGRCTPL